MLEKVKEVLSNYTEYQLEQITEQTELVADMGFSSLDVVNIVVAFEDEFNIEIPDKAIKSLHTIGDIVCYINSHV